MSTPRATPREPAEATGIISESAYKGAVVSALLVPSFQLILLKMAKATSSIPGMDSGPFADEATLILQSGMLALVLLPVASTIGSMVFAYAVARWPGVGLYWVMSTAASAMLGADFTAAIIFATGMLLFFVVAAVKMGSSNRRVQRRRPPL